MKHTARTAHHDQLRKKIVARFQYASIPKHPRSSESALESLVRCCFALLKEFTVDGVGKLTAIQRMEQGVISLEISTLEAPTRLSSRTEQSHGLP